MIKGGRLWVNRMLPLIDGKGKKIKKLQKGVIYTGKVKENYILLLKINEIERHKPLKIGKKVFSTFSLVNTFREKFMKLNSF